MSEIAIECDWEKLIAAAREVAGNAYAKYSRFHVGAAVLAEDGVIYTGCNVENASFGLAICAERSAVFNAIAHGCRRLKAIVVTCPSAASGSPLEARTPCGACRQVIAEFAEPDLVVLIDGVEKMLFSDLFPHPFRLLREPN